MEEEIEFLEELITKHKNERDTIDRKHDEECRLKYNSIHKKVGLLENILVEIRKINE